jgi:hypothetical protein
MVGNTIFYVVSPGKGQFVKKSISVPVALVLVSHDISMSRNLRGVGSVSRNYLCL